MLKGIKILLTAAAMVLSGAAASAEITASDVLRNIPKSVILPLSSGKLNDLIEYYLAGQHNKTLLNEFNEEAQIIELTANHTYIKTGNSRSVTLHILPTKQSEVCFLVIETFETPIKDSKLTIYSTEWETLPKLWSEPKAKTWLNNFGKKNRKEFEQEVPYILAEYSFNDSTKVLTLSNQSKDNKFTLAKLRYQWTPKGFKQIK
jgi:hypothetical protein